MIDCLVSIQIYDKSDLCRIIQRTFPFPQVPRVGEYIWLAESKQLRIRAVEYCFDQHENLTISLMTTPIPEAQYQKHWETFLSEWDFKPHQ